MMETLPRITLSRAEMIKRVARFKDLKGFDGGLPDSKMPGCERILYNVIGFQPPKGAGGALTSPVGDQAAALAAIKISEGFNLGYCRAKPGRGPMMHNHDTNETFIPMTKRSSRSGSIATSAVSPCKQALRSLPRCSDCWHSGLRVTGGRLLAQR